MSAQEQEAIVTHLDASKSSHAPQVRCASSLKSESEPTVWPLQTVNDNTAAAARQALAMKSHTKLYQDAAALNYHASAARYMPATYHPSLRSRRGLDDSGYSQARKYEDEQMTYERKTQSCRDATSEIISLYSSRNALASNTPVVRSEDNATLTTYPRYPAAQRHLQVAAAMGPHRNWQKTKSPAPYPTRLRRPGTSATSPTTMERRVMDYGRMPDYDRGTQAAAASHLYKASFANNQRRAPPLSSRTEWNKSSSSLPSRSSPGPNHYRTATGRARTPSSTASWVSRPSDRYGMGSTDQSTRSASLTSIVEMYQRPMTASSTCPAIRPSGNLYYDYAEEFNKPGFESYSDVDVPLSPVPHRLTGAMRPGVLRKQMDARMHPCSNTASLHTCAYKGATTSSTEDSFDSYLHGTHDDSIEEIERVIADAISNAAADKLMAASEHLNAAPSSAFRCREDEKNASQTEQPTQRFYGMRGAQCSNTNASAAVRRVSQASLSRNAMALDPAFADFTSLLSSFERLAKSPFSRLDDEDDMDERTSRRSSRLSTMETLDECQAMEKPYQKRHRRNIAIARASTPALSFSESVTEQAPSSGEDTLVLAPEPLTPNRQNKKAEFDDKLMKALPPLPVNSSPGTHNAKVCGASQVRSKSLRSQLSRSNSPGKLRLRVRTPSLTGETETAVASCPTGGERGWAKESRSKAAMRPPPRLRLKVSRNQLGHGQNIETGTVIRNNRLKQCNALADVAQAARLDNCKGSEGRSETAESRCKTEERRSGEVAPDERCSAGGSCQPSDQFNLSYPPTPEESAGGLLPRSGSSDVSVDERQTIRSEAGDVPRRVRPKFSFLRLGLGTQATTPAATLVKPAPRISCQEGPLKDRVREKHMGTRQNGQGQIISTENEDGGRSISIKSERVGHRVKRWASDAKRVVRYYVRRTLVRTPKNGV